MTKALALAIKKIRELAPERQDEAAAMLLTLAEQDAIEFELTPEQIAEVEAAIREADAGKFASESEVKALFAKYGV